jgi:hypothetical protein
MHLGRIEFNIVLFMDWSFASGCSPPRLSTTQLPSATDRPVLLSDRDFHPTIGAYFQAHPCSHLRGINHPECPLSKCPNCEVPVPEGRLKSLSAPEIFVVETELLPLQKRQVLLFKSSGPMIKSSLMNAFNRPAGTGLFSS